MRVRRRSPCDDERLVWGAPACRWAQVVYFDSARHTACLRELLIDFHAGHHLLLIGSQGVGKNKLADRMLELMRREREYMQLHRDVTVASLTQMPNLIRSDQPGASADPMMPP